MGRKAKPDIQFVKILSPEERKEEKQKSMQKFGNRIKELREEHDYSLLDLERICKNQYGLKVYKGAWGRWERGESEPTLSNLLLISKIYRVTLDYLVGLTDEKNGYYNPSANTTRHVDSDEARVLDAYNESSEIEKRAVRAVLGVRHKRNLNGEGRRTDNPKKEREDNPQ